MKNCWIFFVTVIVVCLAFDCRSETTETTQGILIFQGKVLDSTGSPLPDANIIPYLNGRPFVRALGNGKSSVSGTNGLFMIEIESPTEKIINGDWALKITRTGFKPSSMLPAKIHPQGSEQNGSERYAATVGASLERYRGTAFWIALAVLVSVYVLIVFEIVHRTLAAFLGAAVLLVVTHTFGTFDDAYKILSYEQALHTVDWNVIFLLMGMMIIVGGLKPSGIFQWLAYKSFQVAKGKIFILSSVLCIVTAVLSAFLDNVTTMLLLTPVTMEIALVLGVSPLVFLIPAVVASNFGGTATLIGDPPNIMIGSYAGLSFNDFLINLSPLVLIVLAIQLLYNKKLYGRDYNLAKVDDVPKMISFLKAKYPITDRRILAVGGTVLVGVIILFILHGVFHMQVSVAALFGGAMIILLNRLNIVELLEHEIEWPSLVFFMMLFIVVGGAEQTGILQAIADWILGTCNGNLTAAVLIILWVAGIASAIVDNIPFTATMLPITAFLSKTIPGAETGVLWWALALGACFGGNGTIIGASANVVTTGIAEKAGHNISFRQYFKEAAPITIISLIMASAYLLLLF